MLYCLSTGWKYSRKFAVSESLRNFYLFLKTINHHIVFILYWNDHLYKREGLKSQFAFCSSKVTTGGRLQFETFAVGLSHFPFWCFGLRCCIHTGLQETPCDSLFCKLLRVPESLLIYIIYLKVRFKASLHKQLINDLNFTLSNLKHIQWTISTLCSRVFLSFMPRLSNVKTWKTYSETFSVL